MNKNTTIETKSNTQRVLTFYSDDAWNNPGWTTMFVVVDKTLPIEEIIEVKVCSSWEEAVKNHSLLSERIENEKDSR